LDGGLIMGNVRLYGSTSGYTELAPPAIAPDGVLTLPSGTGTLATEASVAAVGTWLDWTPSATGHTVGNGTVTARYTQVGKLVTFRYLFVLGSTSAISSDFAFSLPVTAAPSNTFLTATGMLYNPGVDIYPAFCFYLDTTTVQVRAGNASSVYNYLASLTASIPFTWFTGNRVAVNGCYEAA